MSEDLATAAGRAIHLATHPAFQADDARLHCPCCGWRTLNPGAYTRHFLRHRPAAIVAAQWLPAIEFLRFALEQGWEVDEILA